jgi:hypothetical protein
MAEAVVSVPVTLVCVSMKWLPLSVSLGNLRIDGDGGAAAGAAGIACDIHNARGQTVAAVTEAAQADIDRVARGWVVLIDGEVVITVIQVGGLDHVAAHHGRAVIGVDNLDGVAGMEAVQASHVQRDLLRIVGDAIGRIRRCRCPWPAPVRGPQRHRAGEQLVIDGGGAAGIACNVAYACKDGVAAGRQRDIRLPAVVVRRDIDPAGATVQRDLQCLVVLYLAAIRAADRLRRSLGNQIGAAAAGVAGEGHLLLTLASIG